jgi:hypothetical protein
LLPRIAFVACKTTTTTTATLPPVLASSVMENRHFIFPKTPERENPKPLTGVTERVTERVIGRGWRVQSVLSAGARGEARGFVTGASDHLRDWRIRSRTQEISAEGRFDRTQWRVRSVTIERVRSTKSLSGPLLDSNRTPGVTHPVNSSVTSGHALTK